MIQTAKTDACITSLAAIAAGSAYHRTSGRYDCNQCGSERRTATGVSTPVAVELKKGEASFHHPRLVHGSFANHSDHSAARPVVNVMKDGVRSASNDPLLQGIPAIPAGEKVEGRFFRCYMLSRTVVKFTKLFQVIRALVYIEPGHCVTCSQCSTESSIRRKLSDKTMLFKTVLTTSQLAVSALSPFSSTPARSPRTNV